MAEAEALIAAAELNQIGRFFFLCYLNESKATVAAEQAVRAYKTEVRKRRLLSAEERVAALIAACVGVHLKGKQHRPSVAVQRPEQFVLPNSLDLTTWSRFIVKADPVELQALILAKACGFTEAEVAHGLGVSSGTLRLRVSRGLQKLVASQMAGH